MSFVTMIGHGVAAAVGGSVLGSLGRAASYLDGQINPNQIPSSEDLFNMGRAGWLQESTVEAWSKFHGIQLNVTGGNAPATGSQVVPDLSWLWNKVYWAGQTTPSLEHMFSMSNRGYMDDSGLSLGMRRLGYYDPLARSDLSKLRYDVPGPSDLVRFAVRHIFEPDLIKELGYPDERDKGPFLLDIYHQAAGINYPIFTGPLATTVKMVTGKDPGVFRQFYADAGLPEPTWADAYWWAHWVLPSPSQAYQMYFRLRPDRDKTFDPPEAVGQEFPYRNLDLLLRANDYPPKFRPLLAAISRPIPGIRFIRQLRAFDVYTYGDVLELFKRMGYADKDAKNLADAVERNNQAQKTKEQLGGVRKEVIEFYRNGMISLDDAKGMLTQAGVDPGEADKILRIAYVEDAVARTKEMIRAVKSAFGKGAFDRNGARNALLQFGLNATWVDTELKVWDFLRANRTKEPTALQQVKYACEGLISVDQLKDRLTNLGYGPQDVVSLIAEAQLCSANRAARALAAQQRAQASSQRALKQQQRDAARAIQQARQALARHGSPAQLRKWYCSGHIGQMEVYSRLNQLGWPDPDIARLLGDCKVSGGTGGGSRGGNRGPGGPAS